MRRVLLILATLAVVWLAANQAQAHDYYYHGHGYYGWRAPIVVAPRVWPRVVEVAPEPFYPPVVYPPVVSPRPWRYYASPSCGVYYQGPRLSIGVGF